MPLGRAGQYNIAGITNPGPYAINNLPAPVITGVPTNLEGMVGVASWGPVDALIFGTGFSGALAKLGPPQERFADISTHVSAASQVGDAIDYAWVRVSDGTDTAAQATVQTNCGTATALYTGSLGNAITLAFATSGAVGAYAAIVQGVSGTPERFDNIFSGLAAITTVPGTGYTYVPSATVTAPQKSGGVQATVQPTLTVVGTPTLSAGGTGHAVNDVVTLGAGVTIKVLTVTSGAIATFSLVNPGLITSGAVQATVGQQTSTTGSGTGAKFTLAFGLGTPTFTYGSGYYAAQGQALTIALVGGGATTPGSYNPTVSFWAALATALNSGTTQRGKSADIVFTPGSGTAAPTTGTLITLSGGSDGAGGVGSAQLLGVDGSASQRTGMYVLRGSGVDCFELCDSTDDTLWGAMTSMAISEGAYAVGITPVSSTVEESVATRQSVGQDDPNFKAISGDFPSFTDSYFGTRLVSPAAIFLGLCGNLSPEQGTINKELTGVVSTQTSQMGVLIADADESVAETGGIDVIGKSSALGVDYFTFLTGRNSSSNTSANGDEYTRLTNFLMKSFVKVGQTFVGKLQSVQNNDPTRTQALQTFDSFCQDLASASSGSGGYGMIDQFYCQCDGPNVPGTNNPINLITQGYMFLTVQAKYLNVVRYFIINLFGGGNVTVTVSTTNQTTNPTN